MSRLTEKFLKALGVVVISSAAVLVLSIMWRVTYLLWTGQPR